MAKRIDIDTRVDAPREELFDLMADPSLEERWNPDAQEVRRLDDGPLGPGSQWIGQYRGMGEMRITLERYERPSALSFAIAGSRMDMHWTFGFTPEGEGTRLRADAELEPKGAMRILGPVFGPMMRKTFAKRPAQLAAGVESLRGP
jgi:uncharacterized protein YndB with AHSA1/START domain